MSDEPRDYRREVQSTIVKSGFAGVAMTAVAVTVFSPAGFGDWIGTSVASGMGLGAEANAADDVYSVLPAFPTPFSQQEIDEVRAQLSRTEAMMEITRAATEERIQHIRQLALADFRVPAAVEMTGTVLNAPLAVEQATVQAPESDIELATYALAPVFEPHDRDLELAQLLEDHQTR